MKEKQIQVRVSEELREQFKKINDAKSVNGSDLIRKWVKKYVKENDKYLS